MDEDVSEINLGEWREPFTPDGLRLNAPGAAAPFFQVHEVGCKVVDREWDYRRVRSPFWRAYLNGQSGAAVRHAGRRIELGPKRAVLVPAETVFDCVPGENIRHLWVHFSPPAAVAQSPEPVVVALPIYVRALSREVQAHVRRRRGDARLHHVVLAWLHALWAEAGLGGQPEESPRLQRITAIIAAQLAAPPSVGELAKSCGLSAGAFIRWFKAELGVTPSEFISRRRVMEASRLLRYSDLSVEQVAEKTGYANRYHFTRVFSRIAGCGPATYRRGASVG